MTLAGTGRGCAYCLSLIPNRQGRFPLRATAGWRSLSLRRPKRLLDALRKRIDNGAFVITLVCPEEPAANERVNLDAVKFDHKTPKAGPTPRPATTHSACGGFPSGFGFDGRTGRGVTNHADVLNDDFRRYCTILHWSPHVSASAAATTSRHST
jgi:hypothetical protein